MNKDALLATAIGFFIGLCITGLLLAGPSIMKFFPKINIKLPEIAKTQSKPTPKTQQKTLSFTFEVTSPLNEAIETEATLLVSGTGAAGSVNVIQGNTDDSVVVTGSDGKFAGKITLSEGKNIIRVINHADKTQEIKELTVYYTPEEL